MPLSSVEYLRHILDETYFLILRSEDLGQDVFFEDDTLRRAFVRSIEVIGEAAKQVSDDFKRKYDYIEWRAMTGMHDWLVHGYFSIDYGLVWDVVVNKIPVLHAQIEEILDRETEN